MTKVLVTGVNGFVGHHVAHELHKRGISVFGVGNQPAIAGDLDGIVDSYAGLDLTDVEQVRSLDLPGVDSIINLAGFAKVGDSKGQEELYNRVNVGVHTFLYEECIRQNVSPRIIAVSTGAVYDPDQPMPITEESALIGDEKTNVYVISKKLTEKAVLGFNDKGLHCIIVRPFNHTGPGQLPGFLVPDLAEQIEHARATGEAIKVGNLETKRDFTDVRDVARAYVELALCEKEKLKHGLYNICSGKSLQGNQILGLLIEASDAKGIGTEVDPDKLRAKEVMDIYGSRQQITDDIGWEPIIPIEQTIRDFINTSKK